MKRYLKINSECISAWLVFLLFFKFILDRMKFSFSVIIGRNTLDYGTFDISDWLINYEGGFVRRGLIGHLLWAMEQYHLYDVRVLITIIVFLTSMAILLLIVRIFIKEGWSILIIPTGMLLGFTLFGLGGRRDMLSLLLTYVLFMLLKYSTTNNGRNVIWSFLFYVISILQILIHEASFFYTFPIMLLFAYQYMKNKKLTISKISMICLLYFMPILTTMIITCIFKGDSLIAAIIWNSWKDVFINYPCYSGTAEIGAGVEALSWGAQETFLNHLKAGYIGVNTPSYMRIVVVIFNLVVTYFLVSRIDTVNMGLYKKKHMDKVLMSNILLVQFVVMIPMFTVLSCDWGRTIPYWIISSLFFYHFFKDSEMNFPIVLTKISQSIQKSISGNVLLSNNYTYIVLALLVPIPACCAPFDSANTIQQGIYQVLKFMF